MVKGTGSRAVSRAQGEFFTSKANKLLFFTGLCLKTVSHWDFSLESRKVFDFINNTSSVVPVRQIHLGWIPFFLIVFNLYFNCAILDYLLSDGIKGIQGL